MYNINDICDYVILKATSDNAATLNNLKLQKLLYYIQAWHLAFYDQPFFDGKFQAWVHGPVNRNIYDRFNAKKFLYSDITKSDVITSEPESKIAPEDREHIDNVLEIYLRYSGVQLESLTHSEQPWIKARKGYSHYEYCENVIDEEEMKAFYKTLVNDEKEATKS